NKLFSRAGFAKEQDCRVVGRDRLDQLQDVLERRARPYDLLEVHLAAYLFFQIELFLREFVLEFGDLAVGEGVFDGNRDLASGLAEEVDVFGREGPFRYAHNHQVPQRTATIHQRDKTSALHAFRRCESVPLAAAGPTDLVNRGDHRLPRLERSSGGIVLGQSDDHLLLGEALTDGRIERIELER